MHRIGGIALACVMVFVNAAGAQDNADSARVAGPHDVISLKIKSGRLALSSASNPGPVFLSDGAYTNDAGIVISILDGRIVSVGYPSGRVDEVASISIQRDRVMLMPPVVALMQVSPFPLPSGTFTTPSGARFRVLSARPTEFTLAPAQEQP